MRYARLVPVLLLLPGCAVSVRAGPQTKLLRGEATVEGQGTVAIGASAETPGAGFFFPVVQLSGGRIPRMERGTGSFEGGAELAYPVSNAVSLRVGPRVGGTWGGQAGSYLGLHGGVAFALSTAVKDHDYPVLALETLAGPGLSGDLGQTIVLGAALTIGIESYGSLRVPSGRPLRDEGRAVRARVRVGKRTARRVHASAEVGRAWLDEALAEHASIAAFARLSLQLLALGAPAELVEGAHRAALDEIRHARLCSLLASEHLGEAVEPAELPCSVQLRASIEQVAREALLDGVLGEGLAARLAARRRADARDARVRRVLGGIARDEKRHAELAWDVLAWTIRVGRAPVMDALTLAWNALGDLPEIAESEVREDLSSFGFASARTAREVMIETREAAARRLARLLAPARDARAA